MHGGVGTTLWVTIPKQSVVIAFALSSLMSRLAVVNDRIELSVSCLSGSILFLA